MVWPFMLTCLKKRESVSINLDPSPNSIPSMKVNNISTTSPDGVGNPAINLLPSLLLGHT